MEVLIQEKLIEQRSQQLSELRVVSFDLDDTLWECDPVIRAAEQELYVWLQQNAPRITNHCTSDDLAKKRLEYAQTHPEYRIDVTYLRKESLRSLFAEYAYPQNMVEPAFDVFYHARSQVSLYVEAMPMLVSLSQHYKLAALTNGNADLTVIGIDDLFDDVQQASLTNAPKPDSAMFEQTAENLGVKTSQILHVGDNPGTDIEGGRRAGTMTAWFNQNGEEWPAHLQPADFELKNLTTLQSILGIK